MTEQTTPAPTPQAGPPNGTAASTGVAAPARPPRFDPKKSFEGTSAVDRLKGYLKDVPVLHARLVRVIEGLEATRSGLDAALSTARRELTAFDETTGRINEMVARWEKEDADAAGKVAR